MSIKYQSIVFLQGDNANEAMDILDNQGREALLEYLKQWDHGERDDLRDDIGNGSSDRVIKFDEYYLTYNTGLNYCGLTIEVTI